MRGMRARARLAVLALVLLPLTGCVATQRDILDLENQTDELKHQITDLKKTVTSLQANQADLSQQMKQLNETLLASTEVMRENSERMGTLSSKLDDMGERIAGKVADIGTSLSQQQAKNLEEQKAELERAQKESRAASPTELFNTADVRLGVKSYDLAAKGFEEYISKYPKGALVDVATYKLGQAHFGRKRWEDAGRQFGTVLDKYPKSEMTASARLMYALSLINMKRGLDEAKQYLESVVADFPKSPEAKAAQAQLAKLSSKPAR